jgi:hypothetical protein
VGEVREVDLVEDLAVGRRIGRSRIRLVALLVGVGEPAKRARVPGGVDRGVDNAVAEVEVPLRVGIEVREDRAEEAKDERDRRQEEERGEVGPFEPKSLVEAPADGF